MTPSIESEDEQPVRRGNHQPDPVELAALMASYQVGKGEAFDRLYELLAPHVRGFLRWRIYDASRTDDLVQEVFLQMHRARAMYTPPRPVKPWVLGITRYVALMALRKSSNIPQHVELGEMDFPVPDVLGDHFELQRAREALAELPEEKRESILMHYVWGLSFEEVAGVLGISAGAARVRSHRGLHEVRAKLNQREQQLQETLIRSSSPSPLGSTEKSGPTQRLSENR